MSPVNKACAITALIIAVIVVAVQIPWILETQLTTVVTSLAVATALNAIAIITTIKKSKGE